MQQMFEAEGKLSGNRDYDQSVCDIDTYIRSNEICYIFANAEIQGRRRVVVTTSEADAYAIPEPYLA